MSIAPLQTGVYIQRYLEPLHPYLSDPDISEICINRPEEIWIERMSEPEMQRIEDPSITYEHLMTLARQIARVSNQAINEQSPLLSACLPTGERAQIAASPVVPNSIALSIRKQVLKDMSLHDYAQAGAFKKLQFIHDNESGEIEEKLRELTQKGSFHKFISLAVKARKNIVISGGTSTGKTTFLNALLKEIEPHERIITIEDTSELKPPHKNHLALIAARSNTSQACVSVQDLLEASLRLRPDRLLLGELRGKEAYSFLRAVNTGHPGSITTVHADTPRGALEQICFMVMQARLGLEHKQVMEYIGSIIDIVIQLKRIGGKRQITDVWYP